MELDVGDLGKGACVVGALVDGVDGGVGEVRVVVVEEVLDEVVAVVWSDGDGETDENNAFGGRVEFVEGGLLALEGVGECGVGGGRGGGRGSVRVC